MSDVKYEKLKLTRENALISLLGKICREYSLKDLYRVARVCKSWDAVVKKELKNRGMQRLVLHENLDNVATFNQLRVEPYIALLFIQQDFEAEEPRELTASTRFITQFPELIMTVGASRVYVEKHFNIETDVYDENSFGQFNPWEIPCLIIPKHEKFDVKYVVYSMEQIEKKSVSHIAVVDNLMPKNKEAKTIFMFFVFNCKEKFIKKVLNCINQKYEKDNYVFWGSELFFLPFVNNCKDGVVKEDQQVSFLGISISSPNIDLFFTVFPCEDMKISEIYNDLMKFKGKVKLKKQNIALITGPVFEDYYENSSDEEEMKEFREKMNEFYTEDYEKKYLYYFKKVFPEIPFISMFQNNIFHSFGIDMMDDSKKRLMHNEALSIVIIVFD